MRYHRDYTPAAYGEDYLHNLRWGYHHTQYGEGDPFHPFEGGGSFGRGYQRASDLGLREPRPGPRRVRYGGDYNGGRRGRYRRPYRRPGTAVREYGRAYPYFASAAAVEAAQGYPPGDTLSPETYPGWVPPHRPPYDEEY